MVTGVKLVDGVGFVREVDLALVEDFDFDLVGIRLINPLLRPLSQLEQSDTKNFVVRNHQSI